MSCNHLTDLTETDFPSQDELADIALHSESDSVRDECSSGLRSEPEEEDRREDRREDKRRRKPQLGSTPAHLSLSTTSSLSSTSNTSQARLVQSSSGPPPPPPRTSSAVASAAADHGGQLRSELGKQNGEGTGGGGAGGSKTTCMQCYLSGHSDGSLDSVEAETEESSSPPGPCRDRDSGIMEEPAGSSLDQEDNIKPQPSEAD